MSTDENTVVVAEERRRWDRLNPEILVLIFVRLPVVKMVKSVPFVCKGWLKVVELPKCWLELDLQAWCRRRNDSSSIDLVVKKLVQRSNYSVQRLSAHRMGDPGFFSVASCATFLKVLEMPMSDVTDQMVLNHLKPMPNLTILDVSHCHKITSKGLEAFGNQCKALLNLKRNKYLDVAACLRNKIIIENSEAEAIANTMPYLQHFELNFGDFNDSALSEILTKCKSLAHLHILGCFNVKLEGDLAERCEQLKHFWKPWFR
ncbi:putative leucine-rich repeat domain superfamily, F-box-like domain superfamily [Helianthus annuus]|nr:putative leucine-rich repeat domain superfamily, F-box-like domain superfamily [Helianthus annuus]